MDSGSEDTSVLILDIFNPNRPTPSATVSHYFPVNHSSAQNH
jgi:hypothetical protein